jgi:hypothetical protein
LKHTLVELEAKRLYDKRSTLDFKKIKEAHTMVTVMVEVENNFVDRRNI